MVKHKVREWHGNKKQTLWSLCLRFDRLYTVGNKLMGKVYLKVETTTNSVPFSVLATGMKSCWYDMFSKSALNINEADTKISIKRYALTAERKNTLPAICEESPY